MTTRRYPRRDARVTYDEAPWTKAAPAVAGSYYLRERAGARLYEARVTIREDGTPFFYVKFAGHYDGGRALGWFDDWEFALVAAESFASRSSLRARATRERG